MRWARPTSMTPLAAFTSAMQFAFGRYHSVDTGKYSFAPLFAEMLAERIAGPRVSLLFVKDTPVVLVGVPAFAVSNICGD